MNLKLKLKKMCCYYTTATGSRYCSLQESLLHWLLYLLINIKSMENQWTTWHPSVTFLLILLHARNFLKTLLNQIIQYKSMKTNHTHVIGLSNLWCVERRKVNYNYFMVYKFTASVFESENDWNLFQTFKSN